MGCSSRSFVLTTLLVGGLLLVLLLTEISGATREYFFLYILTNNILSLKIRYYHLSRFHSKFLKRLTMI
ncbi:hypothetical protein M0802_016311 [Mischocyttarus mexicanus]|nr:hypothetical protein M0802_016311 [Mischocyttarus mexicanus]